MWNLLLSAKILRKPPRINQGFTMFEVLVAILVSSAFVLGTLQAMVINAVLQVRAERKAQASFWIQEDLEFVKAQAEGLNKDFLMAENLRDSANNPSFPTYCRSGGRNWYSTGFADKLRDTIGTANATVQIAAERQLVNKPYRLVRVINEDITSSNVLKITYRVGEPFNGSGSDTNRDLIRDNDNRGTYTIATVYAEVIASGAFECR